METKCGLRPQGVITPRQFSTEKGYASQFTQADHSRKDSILKSMFRTTPTRLAATLNQTPVLAFLWLVTILQISTICRQMSQHAMNLDFSVYYLSALAVRHGDNPYKTDFPAAAAGFGLQVGDIEHATDPPTFLITIFPLALMPPRVAYYVWQGFNAALLIAALALLLGHSCGLNAKARLSLAALALFYPPIHFHFYLAQSKIPILLLLVLMMRSMEWGWNRAAGVFLGLAGLLRVFPLLLVGYLVMRRRWQTLIWTLIALAIGGIVTIELLGLTSSLSFSKGVSLNLRHDAIALHTNIALSAAISRFLWGLLGQGTVSDWVRAIAIGVADAALVGSAIWATLRLGADEDPYWCALSVWIVASVLLSPTAWPHYMVLFLIPFTQLASAANDGNVVTCAQWLALLSYALAIPALFLLTPSSLIEDDLPVRWVHLLNAVALEGYFAGSLMLYIAIFSWTIKEAHGPHDVAAGARSQSQKGKLGGA